MTWPPPRLAEPTRDVDAHEHALHAYGEAQHRFEALGGYGIEAEGRRVLAGLGFTSGDMDRPVRDLSGGGACASRSHG
ncbi:MAG: hypothetical protein M5U19_06245 [Microthrixaceae bacterium]|nr:hypothetical protein [Microthrixaceae bacterium]